MHDPHVTQAGCVYIEGKCFGASSGTMPTWLMHGTDRDAALDILRAGGLRAGPGIAGDGVYAFALPSEGDDMPEDGALLEAWQRCRSGGYNAGVAFLLKSHAGPHSQSQSQTHRHIDTRSHRHRHMTQTHTHRHTHMDIPNAGIVINGHSGIAVPAGTLAKKRDQWAIHPCAASHAAVLWDLQAGGLFTYINPGVASASPWTSQ